jgi:hypothetical protein
LNKPLSIHVGAIPVEFIGLKTKGITHHNLQRGTSSGLVQLNLTGTLSDVGPLPKWRFGVAGDPINIPACFLRHELGRLTSANTLLNFTRTKGIQGILLIVCG